MTDHIDEKALDEFKGCVVRKDLAPLIKGGANVPAFVLEYLLALFHNLFPLLSLLSFF